MIVIIGAGPSGLATAYYLRKENLDYTILERETVGATWLHHYDRLHLHTLKEVSALPGLPMPADYPSFPSSHQLQAYLEQYARHFELNIQTGVDVYTADHNPDGWHLMTSQGLVYCDVLVIATGIWNGPVSPAFPGRESFRGQIIHSSTYRNAEPFQGQRVLVVGVGNSGAEIAVDLSEHGVDTSIAVREGGSFVAYPTSPSGMRLLAWFYRHVPRNIGRPILASQRRTFDHLGIPTHPNAPLDHYPVVGYELPEAVEAGQIQVYSALTAFSEEGVRFADGTEAPFDAVILATGYRPAVELVRTELDFDQRGWPRLNEGRSTRNGALYCIGFEYPTTEGFLQSLGRRARTVAQQVARQTGAAKIEYNIR